MTKCKNCGHDAHYHKFLGNCVKYCVCEAVVSWYPRKKRCKCRKYEPAADEKF